MRAAQRPKTVRPQSTARVTAEPPTVRPAWLLGALGLLILAALCCAYLSLCLLFFQGQWQLLYQPAPLRTGQSATPAGAGLAFSTIQFGADQAGVSELSGWWLPAPDASPVSATTVLYLHGGAGSLSDTIPQLTRLHSLGVTVFAIDYRGFGASVPDTAYHPSEAGMLEDAGHALTYLIDTRHLPAKSIVLWGDGIGATLAAELDAAQPQPFRLVLEQINEPAIHLLSADARTGLLPLRLLIRDKLDPSSALRSSRAPKLFLVADPASRTAQLADVAAGPKATASPDDRAAIRQFLAHAP
jgi:pimeloyl-ACP methyl ester carboxylesterase